jgi:microcystin-dependent protein
MPSTYSTNLRLELIATGEQSGAWGNTTNYNLGSLLEQAITGVGSITMPNSNLTLSASSGVVDQSRNAVLVFTTGGGVPLTANRDVIIPSTPKLYILNNLTTGGYALTIKTSAGSGVAVANGYAALVYCDGTNVKLVCPEFNTVTGDSAVPGSIVVGVNSTIGGNETVSGNLSVTGTMTNNGYAGGLVPPGFIGPYAGTTAPTGWLLTYGQAVSRTTYAGLYTAIGTAYGAGDGSTTFNLPDLRGRAPFGKDDMGGTAASRITNAVSGFVATTLGAVGGDQNIGAHGHGVTDPSHTHTVNDLGHTHTNSMDQQGSHVHTGLKNVWTADTGGQAFGGSNFAIRQYALSDIMNAAGLHSHTVTINSNTTGITNVAQATGLTVNTGGTGASANIPPAIILNYIIKT